jgi:signal transduction histidine kinase
MTLRNRLFALVSAAVILAVVLVTVTVSASSRRAFAEVEAQRTAAFVTQFRRSFASEGARVVLALERIAASDAMLRIRAELTGGTDYAPYVNEALPLASSQELGLLDLVAADGTIVSSAHWPARFGRRNAWAIERPPASGSSRDFLQLVEVPEGNALGVVAVHRLETGAGPLYLAGGRRLDRELLDALTLPPGMRALLFQDVEPHSPRQRLIATSDGVVSNAAVEPLVAQVRQEGREQTAVVGGPGGDETVHAIPLAGRDGRVQGVLAVVSSGRELVALVDRIRWSGVAFGGLGIALGFVLSYLVAARVTRPVERLAVAARDLADGDWNVRLEGMRATREIAVLADAFETMGRQLVDQRERLVQTERVAAWRELARRLAHELKNPLFPMRITLDNLRRARPFPKVDFDEVFDESIETLGASLGNLNTVIGRFSDFARMPTPEFSRVVPNDIVHEVVGLFRSQLETNPGGAIRVSLDLDSDAGAIQADGEQLRRALQNLVLNAIDAMTGGGELGVRTRRSADVFRIEVSDTGQGIEPGERDRLFTPYYTTKQHGTGLGLAIVQSVVSDHRGKIWVESTPGRGATFHIELPA